MLLNVHSAYTLLHSILDIPSYVAKGKSQGYTALGLADVNGLTGAYEFYKTASAQNVQPLLGMTVDMPGLLDEAHTYPFILYAKNWTGFQTLMQLSYLLSVEPLKNKLIWQTIQESRANLIYISADRHTELQTAIIRQDDQLANQLLEQLNTMVSAVYIGLPLKPDRPLERERIEHFANRHQIPLVVGQLINSFSENDYPSLKILEAIDLNETDKDFDLSILTSQGATYLRPYQTLKEGYQQLGLAQVIDNTQALICQLEVDWPEQIQYLPTFSTPNNLSSKDYLAELTHQQIKELQLVDSTAYTERLDYELKIIDSMGFNDYFLIVWDIIGYCRKKGIRIGPGRGSSAGSLVAYLLHITGVDPIKYGLLFERFLNPERYTMPDIDIDIPDNKRDQLLSYVQKTYGYHQVAQIATFGTFAAKQSIRDVLRILDADRETLSRWSKAVPTDQNKPMTLERAYKESATLREIIAESNRNRTIFNIALTIEGLPRHVSTHAAAVVINDFPLVNVVPVSWRPHQMMLTQYTMGDVEANGLLKMDFLGLKNLTILDDAVTLVNLEKPDFNIDTIDMNDPATLGIFQQADTNGVFQFESEGIKRVLKQLKPERFEDIVAVNALYRPGPMQQINHFIARKHGKEPIDYIVPQLQPILENTYGIIVYQEQVMQILVKMGQFTFGQADVLRRAMSKKQSAVMDEWRATFIEGATDQDYTVKQAEQVYDYIYQFSNYGFNRAHAVVYSTLAYQLAYIKAHYPAAFYAAILNNGVSNKNDTRTYFNEAKERLETIKPISINKSYFAFTIEDRQLRVGFEVIKKGRRGLFEHIINDRQLIGPYHDFLDFLRRLPESFLKEDFISPLIDVGAFDEFGYNRATLHHNLDRLIQSVAYSGKNISLFEEVEPKIEVVPEDNLLTLIQAEQETLGFSLLGHPIDVYKSLYKRIDHLQPLSAANRLRKGQRITSIGMVSHIRQLTTKKQEPMAFITLTNATDQLSAVVFPKQFYKYHHYLVEGLVVVFSGKMDLNFRKEQQVIINQMTLAENELKTQSIPSATNKISHPPRCFVQINDFKKDYQVIEKLKTLALENPGPCQIIVVDKDKHSFQLDSAYQIGYNYRIQQYLKDKLAPYRVVFQLPN